MFEEEKKKPSTLERRAQLGIPPYGNGWPGMRVRWCTGELKTHLIRKEVRRLNQGKKTLHYIGIAADESKRCKDAQYPLVEWGITEAQALQICYDRGFDFGGLYQIYRRASCWCCPFQRIGELRKLRKYHPELWAKLLEMDNRAKAQFGPAPRDFPTLDSPTQENHTQLNIQELNIQGTNIQDSNRDSYAANSHLIHHGRESQKEENRMDSMEMISVYREQVMENIAYDTLIDSIGRERTDEVLELIVEVLLSKRPMIRIAGDHFPAEAVKSRLMKVEAEHVEYVFECLNKSSTPIRNIKAYLLTSLYNAPVTMDSFYYMQAKHDMERKSA